MKKLVIILLISISFSSCFLPSYRLFDVPDLGWESVEEVVRWTYLEINYAYDDGDFWQYPDETYERGEGDCEDYSILAAYICEVYLGKPSLLVRSSNHTWLEVEGVQWEPQTGEKVTKNKGMYEIRGRHSYKEVMKLIHTKR
jgi:hypothetical protein